MGTPRQKAIKQVCVCVCHSQYLNYKVSRRSYSLSVAVVRDGVVSSASGTGTSDLSPETDMDVTNASFGNSSFAAGLTIWHKSTD